MNTDIRAQVRQPSPASQGGEADMGFLAMSRLGQLYTLDWKPFLAMNGYLYRGSVGTVTGDAGVTRVTGGGAGTTIDLDEPEMVIAVQKGYCLIPVEVHVSGVLDQDANAELGEILVAVDRSAGVTTGGTAGTMYNQLDGGAAFPGYFGHTVTSAITNPTNEEILSIETVSSSEFVCNGTATNLTNGIVTKLQLDWKADYPDVVAGPCQLCVYWGGTAAVTALATVVVGCVPSTWFPTS